MAGAHTDSPCLKLKPNPVMQLGTSLQFAVEVYGGALLAPWFDRDLSLAGRVDYEAADGSLQSALLNWRRAIATVPSLAIHLDREANQNRSINAQKDLPPLLAMMSADEPFDFEGWLGKALTEQCGVKNVSKVLAHELYFYDTQAPAVIGLERRVYCISQAGQSSELLCLHGRDTAGLRQTR
jgi:aspartyl aminopeptidase